MSTSIEWTDETWNPVTGCTKVSAGCKHCYAEAVFPRAYKADTVPLRRADGSPSGVFRGRRFTDVVTHPERLSQPLRWRRPRRVFVNSMSDLFHEDVPRTFIDAVWSTMAEARHHIFQILTKRPARMLEFMRDRKNKGWKADWRNIWLGVSVEDQESANERIPLLLQTPAAVRFVSYEPALGPVDFVRGGWSFLEPLRPPPGNKTGWDRGLDWIIVGGESGPKARPFDVAWARSVIEQCKAAGVPVFVKQLGARPIAYADPLPTEQSAESIARHGEYDPDPLEFRLRDRKGGDPAEWPRDLRVREFPGDPPQEGA